MTRALRMGWVVVVAAIAGCPAETPVKEAVIRTQNAPSVTTPKNTPGPTASRLTVTPSTRPSGGMIIVDGGSPSPAASPSTSTSPQPSTSPTPRPKGNFDPDATGVVVTYVGSGTEGGADANGLAATFSNPQGVTVDKAGLVYISEYTGHRIRLVSVKREVTRLAGIGSSGYADGPVASSRFNNPMGVAVDTAGNTLLVADYYNNRLRRLKKDADGDWTVGNLAGSSAGGPADGKGELAQLSYPTAVAIDGSGVAFVADSYNDHIRRVLPDGTVSTLPGTLSRPGGVAVSAKGEVFIADTAHHRICKLTPDTTEAGVTPKYTFSVLAGSGTAGFADKSGILAQFTEPRGLAVTEDGTLYVADSGNHRIRKVVKGEDGVVRVTTLAGSGDPGYKDTATGQAQFNTPTAVALDAKGRVYVADSKNHVIRRIQ